MIAKGNLLMLRQEYGGKIMIFDKATKKDIGVLTELRIAYLNEDLGVVSDENLKLMQATLPSYYEKHLNKDLMVYVARDEMDIVSCAFLLIVEKPMSPSFITGKTGTVLNVYTKPDYRKRLCEEINNYDVGRRKNRRLEHY